MNGPDDSNREKTGKNIGAEQITGRSMPESLSAEAAVLGSMIIDPVCIGDVIELIDRQAFYRIEHQIIFDAIISLYEKNDGQAIDAVLLRNELDKHKQLEEIGGVEYIAKIVDSVPSSANVIHYSKIIKDKLLQRQIIAAASEILNDAYDETGETADKLNTAEEKIFAITNRNITSSVIPLKNIVQEVYDLIEERDGKHVTGLATGYLELDEMTCGLQNGEMIIIAGRPSMGKTSLALNIAEYIGITEKMPIGIFSLEMGTQQLAERFLCSISEIESQKVRKGMLNTEQYHKLAEACEILSQGPIYIDDSSSLTPLEMRGKSRRLKSQYDIKCVIVDYLQLMSLGGSRRTESRQQEITAISRHLKAMARELNIPVIVLSQLNRSPESREDHRPRMSDLRESGSIEQDADVVIMLHREDYYKRNETDYEPNQTAELIIAKQRNGPTGMVKLRFEDKYTRFKPASPSYIEEPF